MRALRRCAASALLAAWVIGAAPGVADPLITANALFEGRAMLTIDGQQRLLRVGETSAEGVRLVAANAREAVIEIDGRRRTLGLSSAVGGSFSAPQKRQLATQRNAAGEYRVAGTINGRQLTLLVDTGANVIALNGGEARRLGIDYRLRGTPSRVQTASGVVDAWSITLDRVEVAGIVVRNVAASVIEGAHPDPALLGMSWLARAGMREERGVLYLEER
jgi:aspartyl protease family protein